MQVILQEKVANLGTVGDQVKVKAGYGRNFLMPQGKAVPATAENVKSFEKRRAEFEKMAAEALVVSKQKAEKLSALTISVEAQSSEEGKLFGSVGPREVADAITAQGIEVGKNEVAMPDGPIRQTGEHKVVVNLHSDVAAEVVVNVTALAE